MFAALFRDQIEGIERKVIAIVFELFVQKLMSFRPNDNERTCLESVFASECKKMSLLHSRRSREHCARKRASEKSATQSYR